MSWRSLLRSATLTTIVRFLEMMAQSAHSPADQGARPLIRVHEEQKEVTVVPLAN